MSSQQLRQRRFQILKDKAHEAQQDKLWMEASQQGMKQRKQYMTKLAMVVVTAAVVSVVAILNHRRPSFLFKRTKAPPPLYLATVYPHDVVVERDLPRFFQTYSIATPQNKHARKAVIHVSNSRNALKYGTGNLKVLLKAWDDSNVNLLLERNVCGRKFEVAYRASTSQRQDDLLMWCLLTMRIVEGFFLESVEMIGNAFVLAKQRGMIVLQRGEATKDAAPNEGKEEEARDKNGRISNAYYLHPRLSEEESFVAALPSLVLDWLLEHPENTLADPIVSLQEAIYQFIKSENVEDRYMMLEEICQDIEPDRAIGKQCSKHDMEERCCYFVVPRSEGSDPITSKNSVIASEHRTLGEEIADKTGSLQ